MAKKNRKKARARQEAKLSSTSAHSSTPNAGAPRAVKGPRGQAGNAPQPNTKHARQNWGAVPPPDAFSNVRRFPAPAWQQREEEQRREASTQAAGGAAKGKKQKRATDGKKPAKGSGKSGAAPNNADKKQRPQKQVNPARRRRRRRLATIAAVVLLIALGAWFSVTVLFKIDKYEVQGQGIPYSQEEIVGAFGHALGDNLYGFSVQNAQERLETSLPYIEKADIRRLPPSTVQFRLTAAKEAFAVPWQDAFAILSASGKVLRLAGEAPAGAVRIDGLTGLVVEPGYVIRLDEAAAAVAASLDAAASAASVAESTSSVAGEDSSLPESGSGASADGSATAEEDPGVVEDPAEDASDEAAPDTPDAAPDPEVLAAESFEVLWLLLDEFEKAGLEGVTWLNVADPLELSFGWEDRITVKLGAQSGLAGKIQALTKLLADPAAIAPAAKGTLDLSLYLTTGRVYLAEE